MKIQDVFAPDMVGAINGRALLEDSEPIATMHFYSLDRYNKMKDAYQRSIPAYVSEHKTLDCGVHLWACPKCRKTKRTVNLPKFCSDCGKALLWEENFDGV